MLGKARPFRRLISLCAGAALALASLAADSQALVVLRGVVAAPPAQPANPVPTLHSPWSECDTGMPATAGVGTNGSGLMNVSGAGDVTQNNTLVAHVVYQAWTGPVDFVTQVQSVTGTHDYRKGGIIFTDVACNNSLWVAGSVNVETQSSQQGVAFNLSNVVNGRSEKYATATAGAQPPPQWIRLNWDGTIASFYYGSSVSGPWTLVDSETRAFTGANAVGVFCSSGGPAVTELAGCQFTEPTVTTSAVDTGSMSYTTSTQSVNENAGTFTVCATRGTGTSGAASFAVHVNGGTATGLDFTTSDLPQTLSWMAGEGGQKCTTGVHVANRAGTQGSRTIILNQTSVTGALAGSPAIQTVTILDVAGITAAKKWHPGYYCSAPRSNSAMDNQSVRFATYDGSDVGGNTHCVGAYAQLKWSSFETTHGNYASGIALLQAEIAHLKSEPHPMRFIFTIMDEPQSAECGSQVCQANFFPAYVQAAGCVAFSTQNEPGGRSHFKWWIPTCYQYYIDLLNGLGPTLDAEGYFEAWGLSYENALEQDVKNGAGYSQVNFNTAMYAVASAAASALPHTNIFWTLNYASDGTIQTMADQMAKLRTYGVGWGDQDTCPLNRTTGQWVNDGSLPTYIFSDNITAGYGDINNTGTFHAGQYPDNRGAAFLIWRVEDSELGYNSVCGSFGVTGLPLSPVQPDSYGSIFPHWNTGVRASHAVVEHNNYIGIDEQRWVHAASNKSLYDMVNTSPLTHTQCPTDYDTMFGDGSAGSGCNTN